MFLYCNCFNNPKSELFIGFNLHDQQLNNYFTFAALIFFMVTTSDIRTGLILKMEKNLYTVVDFGQNKTARAGAKVWAKLKGVDNCRTIEQTWNSGETIFPVRVEK